MVKTKTFRKNRRNKRKTYSKKRRTNKCSLFKIGGGYKTDDTEIVFDSNNKKYDCEFIFGIDKPALIELIKKYKDYDDIKLYGRRPWITGKKPYLFNYIDYYSFEKDAKNPKKRNQEYIHNPYIFIHPNKSKPRTKDSYIFKLGHTEIEFQSINLYTVLLLDTDNRNLRSNYRIVIELDDDRNFCELLKINEFLKWVKYTEKKNEEPSTTETPNTDTNINQETVIST